MVDRPSDPDVKRARDFAVLAHGTQTYGSFPYIRHLDEVVALLEPFGPRLQVIGYLHDVLEDTPESAERIHRMFGHHTAYCVELVTDPPGASRAQRKLKLCLRLSTVVGSSPYADALIVKAADRLANIKASIGLGQVDKLDMYRREHAALRTAAYRPGLCESMWTEMQRLLKQSETSERS